MIYANEAEQPKLEAADLSRYSSNMSVVLAVILSLTAVAITSKQLTNHFWLDVAAFAIPIPVALYFKRSIGRLGAFVFSAVLILALAAAVVFGM